jgi:hypothetical protein
MKRFSTWILAAVLALVILPAAPANGNASAIEPADSSPALGAAGEATGLPVIARRSLAGRHRLEFRVGYWDTGRQRNYPLYMYTEGKTRVEDLVGSFSYVYWGHDKLAADLTLRGLVAEAISVNRASVTSERAVVVTSAMFGVRIYPISSARTPLRPYIMAGAGPYIGIESLEEIEYYGIRTEKTTKSLGTFGAYFGGGLDIQMGRYLMMGFNAGYNLMGDFSEPLGVKDNYSGFELSAGISLLIG